MLTVSHLFCNVMAVQVVRLGMFEVHATELIHALVKRAEVLRQKLIDRMLEEHQELNTK